MEDFQTRSIRDIAYRSTERLRTLNSGLEASKHGLASLAGLDLLGATLLLHQSLGDLDKLLLGGDVQGDHGGTITIYKIKQNDDC